MTENRERANQTVRKRTRSGLNGLPRHWCSHSDGRPFLWAAARIRCAFAADPPRHPHLAHVCLAITYGCTARAPGTNAMSEILSFFGWPMTELQFLAFVALPAAVAIFGWSAVLFREHRLRTAVREANRSGR